MAYPPVVIVDDENRPIGSAMLKDAWEQGLYYRIVGVIIEDEDGRILLQKRAANMVLDPGKWDLSVAGHVDEGQTYKTAVTAELEEEAGLRDVALQDLGVEFYSYTNGGRRMNKFLKLYRAVVPSDTVFGGSKNEVARLEWFGRDELAKMLQDDSGQLSECLRQMYLHTPDVFASKHSTAAT